MSELHAAVAAEVASHRPGDVPPFSTVLTRRRARARRRRALLVAAPVVVALLAAPLVRASLGADGDADRLLQQGGPGPAALAPATFSGRPVLDAAPGDQAVGTVTTPAPAGTAPFPAGYACGDDPFVDDAAAEVVVCTAPDPAGLRELVQLGPAALTAAALDSAQADQDPTGRWSVLVSFDADGTQAWTALTGQAACSPPGSAQRRIALLVDGLVVSAPVVSPDVQCGVGIVGGATSLVTPDGDREAARDLAARLSLAADAPGPRRETVELQPTYDLGADGRTLTVRVPVGACGRPAAPGEASVEVRQDEQEVVLTGQAPGREPPGPDPGSCRGPQQVEPVTVVLDAPLGERPVLDGSRQGRELLRSGR